MAGKPMPASPVLSRLYFGLDSHQGPILPADFDAFVDTCITPRFPEGLTRFQADGQWKGKGDTVLKERSVVIEIVRTFSEDGNRKVREIVESYKRRFLQEAVMVVETRPEVRF